LRSSSLVSALVPAAAVLVAVLAACADDSAADRAAFKDGEENAGTGGDSPQEPRPNELIGDASAPSADQYRGSPLCHVNSDTCDPDDDGTKLNASYAKPCAVTADPDSGVLSEPKGCRLSGTGAIPACNDANPVNTDGAKCESGADCAPGFDCVISSDVGYCRRYCCSGSCGAYRSQNGAETFCDVQKLQGSSTKAPVCMPIKTCKLFTVGECAENETCSVVTDTGTTGCVANGEASVGEPCDQEHCNIGLACLGQAGSRKCLQLCRTKNGPTCATNQICKTSTIFPDPTLGVCAPAP
jgi:hypothetical protein